MSANLDLEDKYVTYLTDLERVDESIRLAILGQLHIMSDELVEELKKIDPTSLDGGVRMRRKRTDKLVKQAKEIINKSFGSVKKLLFAELKELAEADVAFARKALNGVLGVDLDTVALTGAALTRIVDNTVIEGATISEHMKRQSVKTVNRFADTIRQGILRGKSLSEVTKDIRGQEVVKRIKVKGKDGKIVYKTVRRGGLSHLSIRDARALARTGTQTVLQKVREETCLENDDVIKGIRILATLDTRTSQICMAYSGMYWEYDKDKNLIPVGHKQQYPGPPPYHWNCRSTILPVLKSFDELEGDKKNEITKLADERGKNMKSVQSSMDGYVPAGMNYEKWLKSKSKGFQKEVLGEEKWKLWDSGKLSFKQMIDKSGRPLSVKQLKEKYT